MKNTICPCLTLRANVIWFLCVLTIVGVSQLPLFQERRWSAGILLATITLVLIRTLYWALMQWKSSESPDEGRFHYPGPSLDLLFKGIFVAGGAWLVLASCVVGLALSGRPI